MKCSGFLFGSLFSFPATFLNCLGLVVGVVGGFE